MNSTWHRTAIAGALFAMVSSVASVSVGEDDEFTFKGKGSDAAKSKDFDSDDESTDEDFDPFDLPSEEKLIAKMEKLRREFAFESIAPRLEYENKRSRELPPEVKIGARAAEYLSNADESPRSDWAESLYLLHEEETDEFVKRFGFGMSRRPPPGPRILSLYRELGHKPKSFDRAENSLPESEAGKRLTLSNQDAANGWNAGRAPSEFFLANFHNVNQRNFTNDFRTGYARDRDHVAGFRPHGLSWPEKLDGYSWESRERERRERRLFQKGNADIRYDKWLMTRLELVSLLKHDGPRVYEAEHLPDMEALQEVATRELNEFESKSLDSLREGEDIAVTATLNRIQLVGSIRASKKCLQCHIARHGELLGAFSYDLQRDEPIIDPPSNWFTQGGVT